MGEDVVAPAHSHQLKAKPFDHIYHVSENNVFQLPSESLFSNLLRFIKPHLSLKEFRTELISFDDEMVLKATNVFS